MSSAAARAVALQQVLAQQNAQQVLTMTTDQGVESNLADAPCKLCPFAGRRAPALCRAHHDEVRRMWATAQAVEASAHRAEAGTSTDSSSDSE